MSVMWFDIHLVWVNLTFFFFFLLNLFFTYKKSIMLIYNFFWGGGGVNLRSFKNGPAGPTDSTENWP